MRSQVDDLVTSYLFDERALGSLLPAQNHPLRIERQDAFKLLLRRRQVIEFWEAFTIETGIAESEKRLRFALLLASRKVEGMRKHARARIHDEREILDQVAIRTRRYQRRERQILQRAVRRDAEREVLIESFAYRRDQQLIKIRRLAVELFERRARTKRFKIRSDLFPKVFLTDVGLRGNHPFAGDEP